MRFFVRRTLKLQQIAPQMKIPKIEFTGLSAGMAQREDPVGGGMCLICRSAGLCTLIPFCMLVHTKGMRDTIRPIFGRSSGIVWSTFFGRIH